MWGNVSPVVSIRPPLYDALASIPAFRPISADACRIVPITKPKPLPAGIERLALRRLELIDRARSLRNQSRCKEASLIEAELRELTRKILGAK